MAIQAEPLALIRVSGTSALYHPRHVHVRLISCTRGCSLPNHQMVMKGSFGFRYKSIVVRW